jgi:hypothetical protein
MTIAFAIIFVAVLYFIDRNHVWKQAARFVAKSVAILTVLAILGATGVYGWVKFDAWRITRKEAAAALADQRARDAEQAAKKQAMDHRAHDLDLIEKDVCGDGTIAFDSQAFDAIAAKFGGIPVNQNDTFDNRSGTVNCLTADRRDINAPSTEGCATLRNKFPEYVCGSGIHPKPAPDEHGPWEDYAPKPVPKPAPKKYAWNIAGDHVPLTTESLGGMAAGELAANERVEVLETGYINVKVRTKTGAVGWAHKTVFTIVDPAHVCKEHPVTAADWKDCGAL